MHSSKGRCLPRVALHVLVFGAITLARRASAAEPAAAAPAPPATSTAESTPPAQAPADAPLTLEAFKVEASADAAATAFENKTSGQTSTEFITGKALESPTAQNASDLLKNTAGVTVTKGADGGSNVSIRGMDSRFVRVTVDGQRQGGGANALDNIPPEILQSLEVTKAITPDMDADSIAGTINVTTTSARPTQAYVQGRHQLTFNPLEPNPGFRNSVTVSRPYTLGASAKPNAGFVLTGTFDDQDRLREDIRALREWPTVVSPGPAPYTGLAIPTLTQPRIESTEENRRRAGVLFNTDARFGPTNVFFRTNLSRDEADRTRRIDSFDPASGTPLALTPDFGRFSGVDRDQREVSQLSRRDAGNVTLGGKTTLDRIELDATLGAGLTREFEPSTREVVFRDSHPYTLAYDLRSDPFLPRYTFVDEVTGFPVAGPAPASQSTFNTLNVTRSDTVDRELTARFNLKYALNDEARPDYLKFGGAFQQRHRDVAKDQQFYNAGATPLSMAGLVDFPSVAFHNGGYVYGPVPNADAVASLVGTQPGAFAPDASKSLVNSTTGDTTVTEDIWAAYGMARFEFRPWTLLGGLRLENTRDRTEGLQPAGTGVFKTVDGGTSYLNVLPGLHLRYEPRTGLVFRSSVTEALARPSYGELPPSLQINFTDGRSRVGNPDLKPYTATNYDFSVDKLDEQLGLFSGALFYKSISNFILDTQRPVIYPDIDPSKTFIEFQCVNGGPAQTMGVELSWQSLPLALPVSTLGNGSVSLTYTWLHSETHYPDRPGENIPFYRQPDHQLTLALRQEGKNLSSDFSVRYRSAQLEDTIAPGFDNYREGGYEADAGLAYKYSKTLRFTLGAANLLNRPIRNYSGTTRRMNQYQRAGIDYSLGVQWKI